MDRNALAQADLYLRLSIDVEGKTSIERQDADCRTWCANNGLTVRHVHVDRGISGYSPSAKRGGFDAALKAVTAGEVGTLVVWKIDRLSRRGIGQVGPMIDALDKIGGRLVAVVDGIDTSQQNSRLVLSLLSEVARAESTNTGLRVRSAKSAMRAGGKWLGGAPPFGLKAEAGRLTLDPAEAPLVREAVNMALDGASLLSIAREWNERAVPTKRGGQWRPSTLSAIFRSPALAGLMPTAAPNSNGSVAYRDPITGETVSIMADGVDPLVTPAEQARLLALMDAKLWPRP